MQLPYVQLLIIEDDALDVEIVREWLAESPSFLVTLEHCETLAAGLERLKDSHAPIHVALLDLNLPDAQGLSGLLKLHQAFPKLPIIIFSGNTDERLALEAVQKGAQDYLIKGQFDGKLLQHSIRYAIERQKLYLELEDKTRQLQLLSQQLETNNQKLEQLATIDSLTQVNNRRQLDQLYQAEWKRLCREQRPLSLLMCDVDCFKAYNDAYGHPAGDLCLQQIAQVLLKSAKRPADCVARYGGEEFMVVLPNTDVAGAVHVAGLIQSGLHQIHLHHAHSSASDRVTLSIGVASQVPMSGMDSAVLIAAADQALYAAKNQGRNCIQAYPDNPSHPSS
ncbi:MAG: diguanylate cyclase [Cyanobacteria bacterium P01_A01_bin.17]